MESQACTLCGTPTPRPEDAFCCEGCARVAEILESSGYAGDVRQAPAFLQAQRAGLIPVEGSAAPGRAPGPALALDEAQARECPLEIDGMWCPSCAWLIEHTLRTTPGVISAEVSFLADRADIRFDPAQVGKESLEGRVKELGYAVKALGSARETRGAWIRFGISAVLFANVMMISYAYYGYRSSPVPEVVASLLPWLLALLTAPILFGAGWSILRRGVLALRFRSVTMDTLITAAALSAFAYSLQAAWAGTNDLYFDVTAALVTFWLLGRLIEQSAFRKAVETTDAVRRLLPRKARRLEGGEPRWVDVVELQPGDRLRVAAGERVPVDGRLLSEEATVSTAIVDGEPRPRTVRAGDAIPGGATVGAAALELEVAAVADASMLARVADHVAAVAARTGEEATITDALARALLPVVIVLSLCTGAYWITQGAEFPVAFERALAVLVVSCPCALAVAAPLARVVTATFLARRGVVVRGEGAVDAAGRALEVAFDKTGTLTRGEMSVAEVRCEGIERGALLRILAALEERAGHPIAFAISREVEGEALPEVEGVRVEAGRGVRGRHEGALLLAGRPDWVVEESSPAPPALAGAIEAAREAGRPAIAVAREGRVIATLAFDDPIRGEAAATVERLHALGLHTAVLSGDAGRAVAALAAEVGVGEGHGDLLPEDKAAWLEERHAATGERPIFVGDGVNDAPALAAGVGVAVAAGTDFARETAAVLLLDADLGRLVGFVEAARRMRRIIKQNLAWAFAYNVVAVALAASGNLDPVIAAGAMVSSSVLVTMNSLRLRRPA
ncbi:MAG: cation-translocating P-type ATPase [Deltaproteobacteria bacterium]|nr:cation-translocating P-type ATPase [Deltaproteobacteria bacterium]